MKRVLLLSDFLLGHLEEGNLQFFISVERKMCHDTDEISIVIEKGREVLC